MAMLKCRDDVFDHSGILMRVCLKQFGVQPDFAWGVFVDATVPLAVVSQHPHLHIITTVREGEELVTYNHYIPNGIHFYISRGNDFGDVLQRVREPTPDEFSQNLLSDIISIATSSQSPEGANEPDGDLPLPDGLPDYTRPEDRAEADERIALLLKHFTTAGRYPT